MTNLPIRWEEWGILRNGWGGGYPSNGGIILEWGVDTPLQTMNEHYTHAGSTKYCAPNRVTIFSESL